MFFQCFFRANLTNADFRKMLMTPAPKQAKVKPQVTIANVEKEKLKERERRLKEKKVGIPVYFFSFY